MQDAEGDDDEARHVPTILGQARAGRQGVVLAAVGGFVGAVMASLRLYPACEADFSEATIVAPDSGRGRVLCSIATDGSLADDDRVLYV